MMGWEGSRAHHRLDYEDGLVEELFGFLMSRFVGQWVDYSWDRDIDYDD